MARNKFPGTCNDCGKPVAAGAGHFQRVPGRGWIVRHAECVNAARAAKAERPAHDLTAFALGATFVPCAFGAVPFVLWLCRLNGWC